MMSNTEYYNKVIEILKASQKDDCYKDVIAFLQAQANSVTNKSATYAINLALAKEVYDQMEPAMVYSAKDLKAHFFPELTISKIGYIMRTGAEQGLITIIHEPKSAVLYQAIA